LAVNFFAKPCCNDQYEISHTDSNEFLLRLFEKHTTSRRDVEHFIHQVFARAYGADINHVLPRLMALSSKKGRLLAALGMQEAAAGSLNTWMILLNTPSRSWPVRRWFVITLSKSAICLRCTMGD
jgi:hypothetical protein